MAIIAKKTHILAEIMTDADNKVNISGYLTIGELSAYLSIKSKTLYARVKEIPHYKVGRLIRFRKDDIDAWMERHRVVKEETYRPAI